MTDETKETFQWKHFFSGLVNPLNFAKSFVFMLQMGVIILVLISLFFTGLKIKRFILKEKPPAPPVVIQGNEGAQIHNSADDVKKKYGLFNIF